MSDSCIPSVVTIRLCSKVAEVALRDPSGIGGVSGENGLSDNNLLEGDSFRPNFRHCGSVE